jgi:hypothetical protein
MAAGPSFEDMTFKSSMQRFMQLCCIAACMEIVMVALAFHAAHTIPSAGDPTYRHIKVGVPAFWAVVLPLAIGLVWSLYADQSLNFGAKALIFRKGRFTMVMPWSQVLLTGIREGRFDGQLTVTSKGSQLVVRSLFFPQFEEIRQELERRLAARSAVNAEFRV